jgi:hypothetical protein
MSRGSQFGVAAVRDKPDKAEFVFLDHAAKSPCTAKSPCPLCSSEEQVADNVQDQHYFSYSQFFFAAFGPLLLP